MDSLVMMKLGDFKFAMSTAAHQSLERENSWRWPTVDAIGVKPRPQYVGPGADTIRLAGVVYPHFAGAGLGQIDAMRAEADKGRALRLVCGQGNIWGWWSITGLREGQRVFWSNGAPRAQEFELSLLFYGDRDSDDIERARRERFADLVREHEVAGLEYGGT